MITDEQFIKEAEKVMETHPTYRNVSFSYFGKTYWIKRRLSNGRKQFAKKSVNQQFYAEIARSSIAYVQTKLSPKIVYLCAEYMITEGAGCSVGDWIESDIEDEKRLQILFAAGTALGKLHHAGITHGRPSLRDFLYDGEKITLIDWENTPFFENLDNSKAVDYLLMLLSLYREPYDYPSFIKALEDGYLSIVGVETKEQAKLLLKKYSMLGVIAKSLDFLHMKDVEAFSKLYRYLIE